MSKTITVVGSCMIDFITFSPHLPKPGETLLGTKFEQGYGGKGANQCVTAARLGARTVFICSLGSDSLGQDYLQKLEKENIDVSKIKLSNSVHSGIAQIAVAETGENSIVIVPGANSHLLPKHISDAKKEIQSAAVLVCQFEISTKTVLEALKIFKSNSSGISIVNAAPARKDIDPEIFRLSDIFCVNEIETEQITGVQNLTLSNAQEAIDKLLSYGCKTVIITFGSAGSVHGSRSNQKLVHIPAEKVKAVDTTGAGDAFVGALAYYKAYYPHLSLEECIKRSNKIASISVTKSGTQTSFPFKHELPEDLFKS